MDNDKSYSEEIHVSASPQQAFQALTKEINKWWTTSADMISDINDEVTFKFDETYWKFRVEKLETKRLVLLKCIKADHFYEGMSNSVSIRKEWIGTCIEWKIEPNNEGTKIILTHKGLTPALECYDICEQGWEHFFGMSLKSYLDNGKGHPFEVTLLTQ